MPDNSADYEDDEGLQPEGDEDDVDDHPARVWNLLVLINPGDEDTALAQFDAWRETQAEADGDEGDDAWLWALKDVIDWRSGFYVDWKDTDSFIAAIDELSARWNLRIDWGGDLDDEDFAGNLEVPDLMAVAFDRLREHGYSLWNWNTGGDAYAGWFALSRDDDAMLALTSLLGVEVRLGNEAF
ncbi:hypothetical protein ACE15N_18160 [Xanthomonas campestris pv. passiflorae]|uniref:DUF6630 domain-containing protein n=1 Tax=Xanthomonas campestris pv. phaseoli TaxID=317013 RepID=A0AB38E5V8_XANCH|nr:MULTISPECIES: hypothetical protein [Xanthomonas]ATS23968.1 hypothetical protein XppCFBP412P_14930 [Xanthomonas phaseoli pv. phaseoli]ATS28185.1 hypothetical protein XppCFBP6164P_07900 [Xanthomonas phaseoli pv. phaseoli]ATS32282.1 hypothetical protein XppCFBP6546P_15825 [Xanthomonas phaseoli pv. phaseoli]ATS36374.1 hypothetical protein XppCFBP6982P_07340 [Xanthomonas phaseoli pv. phaseoli]AZU14711.1 hypothetical protein AC609_18870 [Xanthomonas phaseoli pv. phaseoli]